MERFSTNSIERNSHSSRRFDFTVQQLEDNYRIDFDNAYLQRRYIGGSEGLSTDLLNLFISTIVISIYK